MTFMHIFCEKCGKLLGLFDGRTKCSECELKESDAYVRDHLLIQWLIENDHKLIDSVTGHPRITIEDIYERWIEWLKEKEVEHDKRSEI